MDGAVRRPTLAFLLLAAAASGGCTAGIAVGHITLAQKAIRDAEAKGASELAAYEYRLAVRHLEEAWEEHGDSEYKTCMAYADQAKVYAEQATLRTEGGGRALQDLKQDVENLEDLTEAPSEERPETTAPEPVFDEEVEKIVPTKKKGRDDEEIEDFLDKDNADEEIDIEGADSPPPAPPAPATPPPTKTPTKTEPKTDPTSPWGKRK